MSTNRGSGDGGRAASLLPAMTEGAIVTFRSSAYSHQALWRMASLGCGMNRDCLNCGNQTRFTET
jgi:hypothetical protein